MPGGQRIEPVHHLGMLQRSRATYLLVGALAGITAIFALRFALVPMEEPTHYHANFALFVDGEKIDLSDDRYMEDVATCVIEGAVQPRARAHLHNNDPDVAHVHHEGVTWGHLLANLGFGLGDDHLAMDDERVLVNGGGHTLKFILNGGPQYSVHNELIRPGDRLLISWGRETEAEVIRDQAPLVPADAEEFDQRADPAGCAGPTEPSFWDRIRHVFMG
jgi:hypothetical protein